jgi:hypothetical protein
MLIQAAPGRDHAFACRSVHDIELLDQNFSLAIDGSVVSGGTSDGACSA